MNGYTSATPTDLILDSGQLRIFNTVFGVTRGSLRFDPGIEIRNAEFDGKRAPVAGLDRIIFRRPTITCTLLETSTTKLAQLMPGSSSATVGAVTTITPPDANVFLTSIDTVRAIFQRSNGRYWEFRLSRAMPIWGGIEGADQDEAGLPVTFEGRALGTDATTIIDAPYTVLEYDAIPTVS
jgi:hypothetical protein